MDNLGFNVDESLAVVGQAAISSHCHGCVAMYQNGGRVNLRTCGAECSHEGTVAVYGKTTTLNKTASNNNNMPSNSKEEAALLGVPVLKSFDNTSEFELKSIKLQCTMSRRDTENYKMVRVSIDRGELLVAVQGDPMKPAIFTYHDMGLNYLTFERFFNFVDMRAMLNNFCVYHINAPGHEEDAPNLPLDYVYPTMDELANHLNFVLAHFGLRSFIGFGVGIGANILARFALMHPQKVDALILINCVPTQANWLEWAMQKIVIRSLRNYGMTKHALDDILFHHFGINSESRVPVIKELYRTYLTQVVNPFNISLLIEQYTRRSDLNISRDNATLKVPVLNIAGSISPYLGSTVDLNSRLDPRISTWMKISDCAMVLEEQPGKLAEAFRLFLQGEGYVVPLSPNKMFWFRRSSRPYRAAVINITENPISDAIMC